MALFASAYLRLYRSIGSEEYRIKGINLLEWLLNNRSPEYINNAWGPPYAYSGRDNLPFGTPTTVIVCVAIQALLDGYEILKDDRYLIAAEGACRFLLEAIPRIESSDGSICFSKAPHVNWYIHNSNIYVATMLVKTSRYVNNSNWSEIARRAVNHTIAHQQGNGSWFYWSPPSRVIKWIDNYHTGFILRCLHDLLRESDWLELKAPLIKGLEFYLSKMFTKQGIPKYTERSTYPIDIHGCAEAIFCLSQLRDLFPQSEKVSRCVFNYTNTRMRDSSGYFYYRDYSWMRVKIPYMRWGQAWMMRALVEYMENTPSAAD
jgi:hypothetical protein